MNDILDGFDNQSIMSNTLKELVEVLHDPQLPYAEVTTILSSLSGRIPSKLEDAIHMVLGAAKAKGDTTEFPAVRFKKIIDNYLQDSIIPQDRAMFRTKTAPLYDALARYHGGLKGHETETIANLLSRYEATERPRDGNHCQPLIAVRSD